MLYQGVGSCHGPDPPTRARLAAASRTLAHVTLLWYGPVVRTTTSVRATEMNPVSSATGPLASAPALCVQAARPLSEASRQEQIGR